MFLCGVVWQTVVMWHLTLSVWHKASQAPLTPARYNSHCQQWNNISSYVYVCVYHISVVYYGNITYINIANSQPRPFISSVCSVIELQFIVQAPFWWSKVNYKAIIAGHFIELRQVRWYFIDAKNIVSVKADGMYWYCPPAQCWKYW